MPYYVWGFKNGSYNLKNYPWVRGPKFQGLGLHGLVTGLGCRVEGLVFRV